MKMLKNIKIKRKVIISAALALFMISGDIMANNDYDKKKPLSPEEKKVIIDKGTEIPYSGDLLKEDREGTFTCRQCGEPLFYSNDKFDCGGGWPSFDEAIPGRILRVPDDDGKRTEIICANCRGHLGHVFFNEGFTDKNTRYCVNSISMDFIPGPVENRETAIFAGGCFWGVEYYMEQIDGVKEVVSGYTGGRKKNPDYEAVCRGNTGHYEAVKVIYDPAKADYETIAKTFFEIHDPTQRNGQGPDIGKQYRSAVFYMNEAQKKTAEKLIGVLKDKGYKIATKLLKAGEFYKAETYHQDYYDRKGTLPYCHSYVKRF